MRIVLFVPSSSVKDDQPSEWLKQRLDAAISYYQKHLNDICSFVLAGRWSNVTDTYHLTEAEICKRYITNIIPDTLIIKEDLSVETGGNFAFAKPLIASFNPEKVVIFNSQVNAERNKYMANKIFNPVWNKEFIWIDDTFSQNPKAQQKEPKALTMFKKLFKNVTDGDDLEARQILLYKTPFYYKGIINDKDFFDKNWPGGFNDFIDKRLSIANK